MRGSHFAAIEGAGGNSLLFWRVANPEDAADAIHSLQAKVAELEKEAALQELSDIGQEMDAPRAIPRLENCGKFFAVDNKGQWHYLNHGDTWQGMPSLTDEARKAENERLREALEQALPTLEAEAEVWEKKGAIWPEDAAKHRRVFDNAAVAIHSLKD